MTARRPRSERRPLGAYIRRVGQRKAPLSEVYAYLLVTPWRILLPLAMLAFIGVNLLFAFLYWLVPGSVANVEDGDFLACFYFSVQTFGAIGYGFMYSDGHWANALVTVEAFFSLIGIAFLTGLTFAKASRPHARVLFSEVMCVEQRDGVPTLTFRMANERGMDVVEASVRLTILMSYVTQEGSRLRRFHDLKLERSLSPLFLLTWQVFHRIDESSPLHGLNATDLATDDVRVLVAMTGLDSAFQDQVHARHLYWPEDIRFGHRFVDVLSPLDDGVMQMDFGKFHDTEPQVLRDRGPRKDRP